jgi:hypothetical protein
MARLTLSQFQHLFSQASRRPDETLVDPGLLNEIIAGGSLSSETAVEVYRTGHIVRLTEALGETFEAVWWVAGDDDYFSLAKEFLLTHPSASYNLSDFGESFPAFLAARQPFPDLPFLADLARFEWVFKEVFHLPSHTSLTPDQFQQHMLTGNLRFTFAPSVHLFHSPYSVYEIWKRRGTEHESLSKDDWKTPQWLLLYKHQQQIYVKHLNEPEYLLLDHLWSGASIEESLERTMEDFPDLTASTVSDVFQIINHTGIVTHLKMGSPA